MFTKVTIQEKALPVTAGAVVRLTEAQAFRRRHIIAPHGKQKGVFVLKAPCEFKVGEELEIDVATANLPPKFGAAQAEKESKSAEVKRKAEQDKADAEAEAKAKADAEEEARKKAAGGGN